MQIHWNTYVHAYTYKPYADAISHILTYIWRCKGALVFMHIHMQIHWHTYIHEHTHKCNCTLRFMNTQIDVVVHFCSCACTCKFTGTLKFMHTHMQIQSHTFIFVHTHSWKYTGTHMFMHTFKCTGILTFMHTHVKYILREKIKETEIYLLRFSWGQKLGT